MWGRQRASIQKKFVEGRWVVEARRAGRVWDEMGEEGWKGFGERSVPQE